MNLVDFDLSDFIAESECKIKDAVIEVVFRGKSIVVLDNTLTDYKAKEVAYLYLMNRNEEIK